MATTTTQHDAPEHSEAPPLDERLIALLIHEHETYAAPAYQRLWNYYRNELDFSAGNDSRPYSAAQSQGLPDRLAGKETVIENDIAWRIHTLVDFMFGKPVAIQSLAADPRIAADIEKLLNTVIDASGGICFFQNMALLGGIYGHVDVLLRADQLHSGGHDHAHHAALLRGSASGHGPGNGPASKPYPLERAIDLASQLILETVEAPRAVPVLDPSDYRRLAGYIVHYRQLLNEVERGSLLSRLTDFSGKTRAPGRQASVTVTEVWTADAISIRHDGREVLALANPLGRLPVVHIQNLPQPFFYEGLSEVEPLIPLQDELNTRLSDRANRVTMQSFRMYLGKGIEHFTERPIAPGQMWMTDNPSATIETFGGDTASPSEESHINEIREAMDKTSGVTAVAAGLLRDKVGNLTSENALRIVMMGLLAKTEKKRITYGKGIEQVAALILHTLDVLGIYPTHEMDRRIKLHWPSPLPEDQSQRLRDAELKLKLGVPQGQVLAELGYMGAS